MRLSENFWLSEFLRSQVAVRNNISMQPPKSIVSSLEALCKNLLQPIRNHVNERIYIGSGWRPQEVNKIIGGSAGSYHLTGDAADIEAESLTPRELFEKIKELNLPELDKVILEFDSWVHIQQAKPGKAPRRQFLIAEKEGDRTVYSYG